MLETLLDRLTETGQEAWGTHRSEIGQEADVQFLCACCRMHMFKTAGHAIAPLPEQVKSCRNFQPLARAYNIHFIHSSSSFPGLLKDCLSAFPGDERQTLAPNSSLPIGYEHVVSGTIISPFLWQSCQHLVKCSRSERER